jgi:hypothetical protein
MWLYDKHQGWKPELGESVFLRDLLRCTKFETWRLDFDDLARFVTDGKPADYGSLVARVYRYYACSQGKPHARWGDKNSLWREKICTIDRVYPQSVVLHIVRDGRDVACSYRELQKKNLQQRYAPALPTDIEQIARTWSDNVRSVRDLGWTLGKDRYYEFRYEDLLDDPQATIDRILQFLGLAVEPLVSRYLQEAASRGYEPAEFLAWKEKLLQPIDRSNKKKYTDQLSAEETKRFERIAADELGYYGYI